MNRTRMTPIIVLALFATIVTAANALPVVPITLTATFKPKDADEELLKANQSFVALNGEFPSGFEDGTDAGDTILGQAGGTTFSIHSEGDRTIFIAFNQDNTATISAFYAAGGVTGVFVAGPNGRGNLYTPIGFGSLQSATIQPPFY